MMMRNFLIGFAGALALAAPSLAASTPELFALKVGRAETAAGKVIEHAVILIENGKILTIGQDLEIERGIPVIDRPDLVVTPGFIDCYSRAGMSSSGGSGTQPSVQASVELYPRQPIYQDLLEVGVTTLGLYPPGNAIPGQAVAVSTAGKTRDEMILAEGAYLKILMQSNATSRKMLDSAFEKVEKYHEAVEKAREKWEKSVEKWEKEHKQRKKDEKDGKELKPEDPKPGDFVAPEPDATAGPFLKVLDGELPVLFSIRKAGDFLHLEKDIGEREFQWSLRVPLRNDIDLFQVADKIGEAGLRVVLEPRITLMEWTMRERNIPAELQRAGAHIVFIPNGDDLGNMTKWRLHVGHLVKRGMDHDAALAAMTIEPARELGLDERLGSLEAGKDANLLFFDGDPFQASTKLVSVMSAGEFVGDEELR
jgi:imidazolonepropionase-like amidohydrolase